MKEETIRGELGKVSIEIGYRLLYQIIHTKSRGYLNFIVTKEEFP
ncbi:hypothetical protein GCM10010917_10890 [Paenibacillus physcomitrellae]|uniref:Uncharacterized protein n=1 Tax=Paenibacillus physcomitrellae TaxID=1619311 RepID=A0ABQ1FRE2_9BACL|nr:hypothetical protein GCM10010917_10890 [Paenibacillus physcomitrellae]